MSSVNVDDLYQSTEELIRYVGAWQGDLISQAEQEGENHYIVSCSINLIDPIQEMIAQTST
jgi:hypothetical protein